MKKSGWFGLALAVLAVAVTFFYDYQIIQFITSLRKIILTQFLFVFGFISNIVILFFFLTSLFLWQEHKRRWILPLWLSLFGSAIISYGLKFLIGRPRPFLSFGDIQVLAIALKQSYLTWSTSFPSAHAMIVFSALPVLDKEFPKFKYVWLVFAVIVAFSRVYFGVHYASDVLVGAILGYGLGLLFVMLEEKYAYGKKLVKKI
jgi:membrane-associated phospholipid phosphatase